VKRMVVVIVMALKIVFLSYDVITHKTASWEKALMSII
jgi:hypothetical protein